MKKIITKPWYSIIGYFVTAIIDTFLFGLLPPILRFELHTITLWLYALFTLTLIYSLSWTIIRTVKNRRNSSEELERQREIERKEIDMVRKSNEILLHLIQDEYREKGDR